MKTFLIILVVLVGAVAVGWYVMPDAPIAVESDDTRSDATDSGSMDSEAMESTPVQDGTYVLVAEESSMTWQGSRPLIPGYMDSGTIDIIAGSATVVSSSLQEGAITVDATSISATETGRGDGETMLTRHLKSADWFDAETFGTIEFVLTGTETAEDGSVTVSGDLTIKDTTELVSFPAVVRQDGDVITVIATDVELDRTKWGVNYQSGSFFSDLGEKLIDDMFHVSFTAVFRAQESSGREE